MASPLRAQVVSIVAAGTPLKPGMQVAVVTSMKMEHVVQAPQGGRVRDVLCAEGDQVEQGEPLILLELEDAGDTNIQGEKASQQHTTAPCHAMLCFSPSLVWVVSVLIRSLK